MRSEPRAEAKDLRAHGLGAEVHVAPEPGFRGLGVDEAELLAVALHHAGANVRVTRGGKVVKIEGYMCQKMSKGMSAYFVES